MDLIRMYREFKLHYLELREDDLSRELSDIGMYQEDIPVPRWLVGRKISKLNKIRRNIQELEIKLGTTIEN